MKLSFFKILSLLCLLAPSAFAQNMVTGPDAGSTNVMTANGKLFTVKLVLGEPIRFYVAGKPAAKVDLSALKIKVSRMSSRSEELSTTRLDENSFQFDKPLERNEVQNIELTTKVKTNQEHFKFTIPKKAP